MSPGGRNYAWRIIGRQEKPRRKNIRGREPGRTGNHGAGYSGIACLWYVYTLPHPGRVGVACIEHAIDA